MRGIEQIPWLYDACCGLQEAFGLAELRQRLVSEVRGRALEIGCGTGRNLRLIDQLGGTARRLPPGAAPRAREAASASPRAPAGRTGKAGPPSHDPSTTPGLLVGVDPSAEALRRAQRRAPGAALVRASAHDLPFRDGTFDTVVSGLVFCSVPDPARGLGEARRVLAPGGALRMLEHVRSTQRWLARLQDWVQPAWTWVAGGCHPNRDTEAAVERAGLRIDAQSRFARGNIRCFTARPPEAATA